jgi:hypothetical protein
MVTGALKGIFDPIQYANRFTRAGRCALVP